MHDFKMIGRGLIVAALGFLAVLAAPAPGASAKTYASIEAVAGPF